MGFRWHDVADSALSWEAKELNFDTHSYDAQTITVYQAFGPRIVESAISAGTFVAPFSMSRMTWIKPSFLWMMMYRSGWASKPGQNV